MKKLIYFWIFVIFLSSVAADFLEEGTIIEPSSLNLSITIGKNTTLDNLTDYATGVIFNNVNLSFGIPSTSIINITSFNYSLTKIEMLIIGEHPENISGDIVNFTVSSLPSNTSILYGGQLIEQNTDGTFSINITNTTQLLKFKSIGVLYINVIDEKSNTMIADLVNFEIVSSAFASNYSNDYSTNPIYFIEDLPSGDYYVKYYASGYTYRFHYFTIAGTVSTLNLALLNTSSSTSVSVYVYDEFSNPVENANIYVYRYYLDTNSYKLVADRVTDFEGKSIFNLYLNDEFYKFYIYYDGELKEQTQGAYVTGTTLYFTINTGSPILQTYYSLEDIIYYVDFNSATNNFRFYFMDNTSTIVTQGCLELYKVTIAEETLMNETCVTGSSAVMYANAQNISGLRYVAKGYVTIDGVKVLLDTESYTFPAATTFGKAGLFLVFILTAVFGLILIWDIPLSLMAMPIPTLLGSLFGFINLTPGYAIGLEVIMIVIAFIMKKRGY